eukprot:COSAG06_NODE_1265_length_10064_cov_8.150828_4_plen_39_part_00
MTLAESEAHWEPSTFMSQIAAAVARGQDVKCRSFVQLL